MDIFAYMPAWSCDVVLWANKHRISIGRNDPFNLQCILRAAFQTNYADAINIQTIRLDIHVHLYVNSHWNYSSAVYKVSK